MFRAGVDPYAALAPPRSRGRAAGRSSRQWIREAAVAQVLARESERQERQGRGKGRAGRGGWREGQGPQARFLGHVAEGLRQRLWLLQCAAKAGSSGGKEAVESKAEEEERLRRRNEGVYTKHVRDADPKDPFAGGPRYLGVYFRKRADGDWGRNRWCAKVRQRHLAYTEDLADAARVYDLAVLAWAELGRPLKKNVAAREEGGTRLNFSPDDYSREEIESFKAKLVEPRARETASKYRGVHQGSSRSIWLCRSMVNKREFNMGRFRDELEAAVSYDEFMRGLNLERKELLRRVNFPQPSDYFDSESAPSIHHTEAARMIAARGGVSSEYFGVSWNNSGKKWEGYVYRHSGYEGVGQRNLGLFSSDKEAAHEYDRYVIAQWLDRSNKNVPNPEDKWMPATNFNPVVEYGLDPSLIPDVSDDSVYGVVRRGAREALYKQTSPQERREVTVGDQWAAFLCN